MHNLTLAQQLNLSSKLPKQKILEIYTDGAYSSKTKIGGTGVYIPFCSDIDIKETYHNASYTNTTNNRMELRAMIFALEYCLNLANEKGKTNTLHQIPPVTIYTDSQYVQRGINEWLCKWRKNNYRSTQCLIIKNLDLWLYIQYLFENVRKLICVNIVWVRGHNGNSGNEIADRLSTMYMFPIQDNLLLTPETTHTYEK